MLDKLPGRLNFQPSLTTKGFLLYSPISILSFPVTILITNKDQSLWLMSFYGVLITILTYLVYITLITLGRKISASQANKILLFLIIPLLTGSARGGFFYCLVEIVDLQQPSNLLERVLSSTLTTIFWLYLANYLIGVSRNFLFKYQAALNQYLGSKTKQSTATQLSEKTVKTLTDLQLNLSAAVERYADKSDPESFRKLSAVLTQQINDQIRPISRRIWIRNLSEFPVFKIDQLFKDALVSLDFSWRIFVTLISFLSLFSNLAVRSLSESALRTLTFLIVLLGIRMVQNLLNKRGGLNPLRINLIYLITYGLLPVLISEAMVEASGYDGDWAATLLISPIAPVLMIVLSLLRLTAKDRSAILEILESSTGALSANQPAQEQIESASVASFLHNSLQSELLALSKKLAEAAENPDKNKAAALLEQVAAMTNRSIAEDFVKFAESPFERLVDVINSWKGILEIELDFDVESLSQNEKAAIIVQTIEEVATNVTRYDNATNLQISAVNSDLGITLSFQSNGGGKLVKAKGLGSNWFDKVAVSQWSITKNQNGSLLIIVI